MEKASAHMSPSTSTIRSAMISVMILSLLLPWGSEPLQVYALSNTEHVYSISNQHLIGLENEFIRFVIDTIDGLRVIEIVNKMTGFNYNIVNNSQQLFLINGFIEKEGKKYFVSYDPTNFDKISYIFKQTSEDVHLIIKTYGINDQLAGYIDITLLLEIWMNNKEPRIYFNLTIIDNSKEFYPIEIEYPRIGGFKHFGKDPRFDRFVKEGLLLYEPYRVYQNLSEEEQKTGIQWASPPGPGAIGIPFFAFYNKKDRTGLYYLIDDNNGTYKYVIVNFIENSFVLRTINYIPLLPILKYELPYTTILGVYLGYDWYDAAEIYRNHVDGKWWTKRKLTKIQGFFPEMHLIVHSFSYGNNSLGDPTDNTLTKVTSYNEVASSAKVLKQLFPGINIALAWNGWEHCGAVVCWPQLFPPVEGQKSLEKTLDEFHKHNITVLPSSGTASYISKNVKEYYSLIEAAIYDVDGNPIAFGYSPFNENIFMDIRHPTWREYLLNITRDITKSGFDSVDFDGTPWIHINYANTKYYTSGDPRGYIKTFISFLNQIKTTTSLPITLEGQTEQLLPFYDMAGVLGPIPPEEYGNHSKVIPFFQYVYHEYIQFNGPFVTISGMPWEVGNNEVVYSDVCQNYFRYILATSAITFGTAVKIGDFWEGITGKDLMRLPEWEIDYIHRLALARAIYARDYLIFGKMTKPPEIIGEIPQLRILDTVGQEDVYPYTGLPNLPNYTMPSFIINGWEAPDGKSTGYVFSNIGDSTLKLKLKIPRLYDNELIYVIIDGVQHIIYDGSTPPEIIELNVPASSVGVLIIAEGSNQKAIGARILGNNVVELYSVLSRLRVNGLNFSDLYPLAEKMKISYLKKDWKGLLKYSTESYEILSNRLQTIINLPEDIKGQLSLWDYINSTKPRIIFDQTHSTLAIKWEDAKRLRPDYPKGAFAGRLYHLLITNGYNVKILTISPITKSIVKDADLLVLLNPTNVPLSLDEAQRILQYIKDGGSLFLQIGDDIDTAGSGLRYLLKNLGFTVYNDVIINSDPHSVDPYGFNVNITSDYELFDGIFMFGVSLSPRVSISNPEEIEVIGRSPKYTYSSQGVKGPFPIIALRKYGKGKVFIIFASIGVQNYDYGNQPLIRAALKWLLDKSQRVLVNVDIPSNVSIVGSTVNVSIKVISANTGLPLNNVTTLISSGFDTFSGTTNENGSSIVEIKEKNSGLVGYTVIVEDTQQKTRYIVFSNDTFKILWKNATTPNTFQTPNVTQKTETSERETTENVKRQKDISNPKLMNTDSVTLYMLTALLVIVILFLGIIKRKY